MKYFFSLIVITSFLYPQMVISTPVHKIEQDSGIIGNDTLGKAEETPFEKLSHLINQYAQEELEKGNINSIALAVYRDGEVFHNYYCSLDKKSVNPPDDNTLYEIASISKVFAGSLAAKAVLEQKISLEDDIRKYLPGQYLNLVFENVPITITNLLTHTLGFKNKTPQKLEEVYKRTAAGYYEKRPFDYSMADLLEELKTVELDKQPGTFYEYNSVGSELLAYVLEQAYGQSYRTLLEAFLSELKMENTYLQNFEKHKAHLANSYTESGELAPLLKNPLAGGGYGIITTLPDLIKLMKFQLESGNPLIKESTKVLYEDDEDNVMGYLWQDMGVGKEEGFYYSKTGDSYGVRSGILICPDSNYGQIIIVNNQSEAANSDWEVLYNKIETDLIKFPRINLKSMVKTQLMNDREATIKRFNALSTQKETYFNTHLPDVLNSIGYDLLYGAKDTDKAIEVFEFATKNYPDNANLFDSLGEAYLTNREYEKARSSYKKSLELNPQNTNARKNISELNKLKTP